GGARLVLIHHAVTSVLLAHVLRRPERAMETCRNGLVEANTLLLILRRRSPRGSRANAFWNLMYLTTLVPVRFVWQPMLFVRLVALTSNDKALERFEVLGAQAFLLGFNVWLVARRRNSSANANTTKKGEKIS
ncbi:unnamed product, partial [Ostreococcus tauri]